MSTQTLAEAAAMLEVVLIDTIQVYDVGPVVTVGIDVVREVVPVGDPIPGLVQHTSLANAVESRVDSAYSIKVKAGTPLVAGQMVEVLDCIQEPSLVGTRLLVDKVSDNGLSIIRKAVASTFGTVNQEGKEGL